MLGEGVTICRGGGAVQASPHGVHRIQRTRQPGKLRRRIINLLLHLAIARYEYEVLRRD